MKADKSELFKRAEELLAEIRDLEDDLDYADNFFNRAYQITKKIGEKRSELESLKMLLENNITG